MAGMKLSAKTQELVRNRPKPLTFAKMEADLMLRDGAITASWLFNFAAGKLHCNDCDKVQLVYEYMTGDLLFGAD